MTLPDSLRVLLACPTCHSSLENAPEGTGLDCVKCGVRFPIRDGIPVMLAAEAELVEL